MRHTTRGLPRLLLLFLFTLSASASYGDSPPLWSQDPDAIRAQIETVRAGRDLNPKSWPGGARVAVSLSFDVDTEPVWLGFQVQSSPSYMSRGEYGARVGMRRVHEFLDRHKIPATFFIPAMTMVLHPEVAQGLKERPRHEVGFHSYVHENPLTLKPDEERAVYAKAYKIFMEHVGKKPVGFRSAAWDLTDSTIEIAEEMGFLYDSSMMADDRPYQLRSKGRDSSLIELPVEWILDDWPYFQLSWGSHHVGLRSAEEVLSVWKGEFDGAYEEGSTFILIMHPQVIGHRYRMAMLDELVKYMKSKGGVWFATHEEIARHVIEMRDAEGEAQ